MEARRKNQTGLILLAAVLCVSAQGAEKVQIRGSTSIELPKPKHSLEELRNLKVPDSPSGRDEYQGGMSASVPATTTNPQVEKKLKELLDKQKNWIFMNPYESHYDSKTEEFLKGEKGSGLYDHPLMKDDEKSMLEQFLEEGNRERANEKDVPEPGSKEFSAARQEMMAERKELDEKAASPIAVESNVQSPFTLEQKTPSLFSERGLFERQNAVSFGNSGSSGITSGLDRTSSREDLRKERDARDAEIVRMMQPRTGPAAAPGAFNPLDRSATVGRQDSSPNIIGAVGAPRGVGALNFGRSEATSVGTAIRNGPIFSGSAPSSLPGRSSFDFGGRASSSASSAFAPSAPSSPISAPRPTASQSPFVLPFPQRKF